jgi:hypothetical protein
MPTETRGRKRNRELQKSLKQARKQAKQTKLEADCHFDFKTIKWPDSNGCAEKERSIRFKVGEIYDRYGYPGGFFIGNLKNTFDERSMMSVKSGRRCKVVFRNKLMSGRQQYHQYRVLKPFTVKTCTVAPFFGHPGGGVQYRLFSGSIPEHEKSMIDVKTNEDEKDKPNVGEMVKLGYLQDLGNKIKFPKFSHSFRT